VDGRPNRGCVVGGSELGHARFRVETQRCYCGQAGCLERIFSTAFLRARQPNGKPLADRLKAVRPDPLVDDLVEFLALGLSNAVNFVRPARLILTSRLAGAPRLYGRLVPRVRDLLLRSIAERIAIDTWDRPHGGFADAAACLALA